MDVKWRLCYVNVTSSYHVASQRIQELLEAFLKKHNMRYLMVIKKKNPSIMMPNGDPRNGFSYLTLTLMIDSYFVKQLK